MPDPEKMIDGTYVPEQTKVDYGAFNMYGTTKEVDLGCEDNMLHHRHRHRRLHDRQGGGRQDRAGRGRLDQALGAGAGRSSSDRQGRR